MREDLMREDLMREDGAPNNACLNWIDNQHRNLGFVGDDLLLITLPQNAHEALFVKVHDANQIRFYRPPKKKN